MLINFIVWNIDPEIFSLGPLSIRYYGLLWALSFILGYLIFERIVKREKLPEGYLDSLTIYMFVGVVAGARLGHCFFYEPSYYLSNPLEIFKIWQGGLASHGAALGTVIALYLFSKKTKRPIIYILDRIVIVGALSAALVRIGNLMNSEIYGIETTLSWGFKFVRDFPRGMPVSEIPAMHPTQIYEALAYFIVYIILHGLYLKAKSNPRPGLLFSIFLILVFTTRFFVEFIKQPQVERELDMALNMGQWLSIPFIIFGIGLAVWSLMKKQKAN